MSVSRAHRRRAARAADRHERSIFPDGGYGVNVGWYRDDADAEQCRRETHDALVAMMGDRRTGGVTWLTWCGHPAHDALDTIARTSSSEFRMKVLDPIHGRLNTHGGCIVVAIAPGR